MATQHQRYISNVTLFSCLPLGSLAIRSLREPVTHIAEQTFVCAALGPDAQSGDDEAYDTEKDVREEEERRVVVDAGRTMGRGAGSVHRTARCRV